MKNTKRVYKNHFTLRAIRATNTRKKRIKLEEAQCTAFRRGETQVTIGHVYSVTCEFFKIKEPATPSLFLERINKFYGGVEPCFSDMSTILHSGLVPTLENFLFSEYGQERQDNWHKVFLITAEAMGIPFHQQPLKYRKQFIDYSTIEVERREKRLASQKPA